MRGHRHDAVLSTLRTPCLACLLCAFPFFCPGTTQRFHIPRSTLGHFCFIPGWGVPSELSKEFRGSTDTPKTAFWDFSRCLCVGPFLVICMVLSSWRLRAGNALTLTCFSGGCTRN